MSLEGRKFRYRYESGLQSEARFLTDNRIEWRALTGPAAGRSGFETAHIAQLRPDMFFVCWVEMSGVAVSQVLDFATMSVTSYLSFDAPAGGRKSVADKGVLIEIDQTS